MLQEGGVRLPEPPIVCMFPQSASISPLEVWTGDLANDTPSVYSSTSRIFPLILFK